MTLRYYKLLVLLAQRGVAFPERTKANRFVDGDLDAARWDPALGPMPTLAEVDAVSDATANLLRRARQRDEDLDDVKLRALARAVHVRAGRPDRNTMDAATWRDILRDAWETEKGNT